MLLLENGPALLLGGSRPKSLLNYSMQHHGRREILVSDGKFGSVREKELSCGDGGMRDA
jgi:hypothetical protein